MLGLIMFALFIFKHTSTVKTNRCGKNLKVLDSISLGARKNLYIIAAGKEKFLIASDVDRTNLISKLNSDTKSSDIYTVNPEEEVNEQSNIGITSVQKSPYTSIMKNLSEKF